MLFLALLGQGPGAPCRDCRLMPYLQLASAHAPCDCLLGACPGMPSSCNLHLPDLVAIALHSKALTSTEPVRVGDFWPAIKTGFALAEGAHQLDLPVGRKDWGSDSLIRRDTDALLWPRGGGKVLPFRHCWPHHQLPPCRQALLLCIYGMSWCTFLTLRC